MSEHYTTDASEIADELLQHIRSEVKNENPYLVGGVSDPDVKLNQNENPFDLPAEVKSTLLTAFDQTEWNRYPTEHPWELRRALATLNDWDPNGIMVGNGSNELTYTLGMCLINQDAKVVLPRPMFMLFEKVVRLFGGETIGISPNDDLTFDVEAVVSAVVEHNPALVVVATPNNPTGLAMDPADVEKIAKVAKGVFVIDEAYLEFGSGSAVNLIRKYPNVLIMRTLSKAYGLAGLRVGYMIGRPALINMMERSRLPFMTDPLSEKAACAMVKEQDLLNERVNFMKTETDWLYHQLMQFSGVKVVPSVTNFLIFKANKPAKEIIAELGSQGVAIRAMGGYPELAGYVRVSAGTRSENEAFIKALKQSLSF